MADVYCCALVEVFQVFSTGGVLISRICCDNEFNQLMEPLPQEFQIMMNYDEPQEHHVREADRINGVIKE